MRSARGASHHLVAPWVAFAALGVGIRLATLPGRIFGDDELHSVRAALHSLGSVPASYEALTAVDRLWLVTGIPLDEWTLRLPALVSAVVLVVVAPASVARRLGSRVAAKFACLLAISPVLVLYSGIARSYMPMLVLAVIAFGAFERWLETRSARAGVLYVIAAAGAIYFHLAAAPFVVSPLLSTAGLAIARPQSGPSLRAVAGLGAAFAVAVTMLIAPTGSSPKVVLADMQQARTIELSTVSGVAMLQSGTTSPAVAAAFWTAAAIGVGVLSRRQPRLAAYTVIAVACQLTALLVFAPLQFHLAIVFNRYALPILPIVLLWVAMAFAGTSGTPLEPARLGLAITLLVLLVATSPFAEATFRRSPFLNHHDFVDFTRPRRPPSDEYVPAFYRTPAAAETRIEFPWDTTWRFARPYAVYREYDHRSVLLATHDPDIADPRLRLRTVVPAEPSRLLATGATYLVVHRDLPAEEHALYRALGLRPDQGRIVSEAVSADFRGRADRLARRLRREWGEPTSSDAAIEVWDLRVVRGRHTAVESTR